MAATSTSALDIIIGALRNINALEAGEVPSSQDASDALQVLNDLIETWSIDKLMIFASIENILSFSPGQYQYTIGNYQAGTFTGTLVAGSPTISNVTIPTGMIVGGTLDDVQGSIQANATILSIGSNAITMSANALSTVASPESITYTIPGNFAIPRPLRITNAFTRITTTGSTSLDYGIEIVGRDKYTTIGIKGLSGPWPILLYYDQTFPLANLYVYPNPSQAGQLHLWTDSIFTDFSTLNQAINLPQGFARALKKNLALELCPEYGKTPSLQLVKQAAESKTSIKSLNEEPSVEARYDADIVRSSRTDAGWVMNGGFG